MVTSILKLVTLVFLLVWLVLHLPAAYLALRVTTFWAGRVWLVVRLRIMLIIALVNVFLAI